MEYSSLSGVYELNAILHKIKYAQKVGVNIFRLQNFFHITKILNTILKLKIVKRWWNWKLKIHWKFKTGNETLKNENCLLYVKKKFHEVQTKHEIPISKNVTVSYISTHAAPRGRSRFFRN